MTPAAHASDNTPTRVASAREIASVATLFLLYFLVYFSPILLQHRLLAASDAIIQYLPALLSEHALWIHYLYAGHPAFADPQFLTFSPLRIAAGNYNAAVIAVYVLAATSAYGLVRHLTGLRMAGLLAGIVYGSGSAMIAHLPHLTIIYSAAFMPLVLWAVSVAGNAPSGMAVGTGAIAIALSIFGGHPQIFVYSLALAALYALYIIAASASVERARLALRYAILFGAGLAIACVQLIPLLELGARSIRQAYSYQEFTSYALAPRDLLLFVFPWILGGADTRYFGPWNLPELTPYSGVATLMLVVAALSARTRERQIYFWLAILLAAVAYALGESTPLASVAFHIPGLNQFRAPARAALVVTLSLAVLAGYGYRALVDPRSGGVRSPPMWRGIVLVFGIAGAALWALYPRIATLAASNDVLLPQMIRNYAVYSSLLAIVLSAIALAVVLRKPSRVAQALLILVLAADLASFGWRCEWRNGASQSMLALNRPWQDFAADLQRSSRRVLFLNGFRAPGVPAAPNLGLLYRLPSVSGYGPLVLKNFADVMGLDVLGASTSLYLLDERLKLSGAAWIAGVADAQRPLRLGGNCSTLPGQRFARVRLAAPVDATRLEIISQLGCSTSVEQDAPVMRIDMRDASGNATQRLLIAGRDTAEWAIDRPDVAAAVKHRKPADFESYPAGAFSGHWFKGTFDLANDGTPLSVASIAFDWLRPPGSSISIRSATLVDDRTGARHSLSADNLTWSDADIAERRALPGGLPMRRINGVGSVVWVVGETVALTDAKALDVIQSGRLPDGREYDPYRTALVDAPARSSEPDVAPLAAEVRMLRWTSGALEMEVQNSRNAFLVVAESFYPGWTATIDGVAWPVVRTNVAFQGMYIPAGRHAVVMSFMPRSLLAGLAAASLGVALLLAYCVAAYRSTRARRARESASEFSARR